MSNLFNDKKVNDKKVDDKTMNPKEVNNLEAINIFLDNIFMDDLFVDNKKIDDKKLDDKKLNDKKLDDKKLDDKKLDDKKLNDKKLDDKKLNDKKLDNKKIDKKIDPKEVNNKELINIFLDKLFMDDLFVDNKKMNDKEVDNIFARPEMIPKHHGDANNFRNDDLRNRTDLDHPSESVWSIFGLDLNDCVDFGKEYDRAENFAAHGHGLNNSEYEVVQNFTDLDHSSEPEVPAAHGHGLNSSEHENVRNLTDLNHSSESAWSIFGFDVNSCADVGKEYDWAEILAAHDHRFHNSGDEGHDGGVFSHTNFDHKGASDKETIPDEKMAPAPNVEDED